MTLKTNAEWIEWGRRDPLFGVASWKGKGIGGGAPWTDEAFYALGESDWRDFELRWRRYGYHAGTFAEIGCGAGRITKQLSRTFRDGHAFDVSPDMIRYASARIDAKNIEWHVTEGISLPVVSNTIHGVFSCHVFQHLPSEDAGCAYFREINRVLRPGGSLMIHLPVHIFPVAVSKKFVALCEFLYGRLLWALDMKSVRMRSLMMRGGTPPMHGISYDQQKLYRSVGAAGFERVEFATFPLKSNDALHTFIMATKPLND